MLPCPECGRDVPRVHGELVQECPHCGAEVVSTLDGTRRAPGGAADAAGATSLAFRFLRRHYGALLLLWVPSLIVDAGAALGFDGYATSKQFPADTALFSDADRLAFLGVAVPLALAILVLKVALLVPTAALVLDREAAGDGRSLASVARRPLRLVASGFALTLLYLCALVLFLVPFAAVALGLDPLVASAIGAVLAALGLLVLFHHFQFAPAALAQRRAGIADAVSASRRFAKERRTHGFTAMVVLVALLAGTLWVGLDAAVAFLVGGFGGERLSALVESVLLWLIFPAVAVFPAAYWALALKGGAAPAEPAAAEAPPASHTKCPQCGTLIPYTSTGAPVHVTCPTCGRAGKVV